LYILSETVAQISGCYGNQDLGHFCTIMELL
jgi:hypothetical protein